MTPTYDQLLVERLTVARLQQTTETLDFLEEMDNNTRPSIVWPTPGAPYPKEPGNGTF